MSPRWLMVVAVSFAVLAHGQNAPSGAHSYANAPTGFAHADLNNDGREDLVTYCGTGENPVYTSFAVSLSTGDGVYAPQVCYPLPSGNLSSVAIGDLNSDGHLDIAIANGTNTFFEYLNNGDGTFHLQASFITSATSIISMVAGDANHDGKIDLIFAGEDGKLLVYFGNGDNGFTPGPISNIETGYPILLLGDFDGDGKADVVVQVSDPSTGWDIQAAYGDGQGHFQAGSIIYGDVIYNAYDVNRDGMMDLVGEYFLAYSNQTAPSVTIQYGNANRTFTESDVALKGCNAGPNPPAAADFNGDGEVDLIVGESGTLPDCYNDVYSETVNLLKGQGNQSFRPEQALFSSKTLNPQLTVLRANQDTKPDLEFLGYGNGSTSESFFINSLSGKFPGCTPPNAAIGIHVCSPGRGTLTSPVSFSIGAANQTSGRKVEVWIDGVKVGEQLDGWSHYSFLDASYAIASGGHTVTIYSAGWDNLVESVTFPITVQ